MAADPELAPTSEICVLCGFCCDATLFDMAIANARDSRESLVAIGITPASGPAGDTTEFAMPCVNFAGTCSVYTKRPVVCQHFQCQLIHSVGERVYTVEQAQQIVIETRALRDELAPHLNVLLTQAGVTATERSVLSRAVLLLSVVLAPAAAHLRERCGTSLPKVVFLAHRLRKYFVPAISEGKAGESGSKEKAPDASLPGAIM